MSDTTSDHVDTARTLQIVVVDDHPVFRMGLVALLGSLPGFEVVAEAATADEAVAAVAGHRVDVVMMDLHLGDDEASGIEATRRIAASHPDLGILVVTMFDDDDSVFAAMRAGARGYLLKGSSPHEIERAIAAVANGEVLFGAEVARQAMSFLWNANKTGPTPFPDLTAREREILDLVAQGLDNTAVARRLDLTNKTVRNHLSNILTKLQVTDRSQAIVRAREAGMGRDPLRSSGEGPAG